MFTATLLAGLLSVHGNVSETQWEPTSSDQDIVEVVVIDDLAGNTHVMQDGVQTHLVTREGQRRDFGLDGSITVVEANGRVWKL